MKLQLKRGLAREDNTGPLGLFRFFHARNGIVLQLDVLRLFTVLSLLAIIAYIAGVAVLYKVRSQRPYNQIELVDIALPWNWSNLSEKAGRGNLAHGEAMFKEKNWRAAIPLLRGGLRRVPEDHAARLQLAQIYQMYGQSEAATNVLSIGLDYGFPKDEQYIDTLLLLLAVREDFATFADISRQLRAFPEIQNDERWESLASLELSILKKERNFVQILEYTREMRQHYPAVPDYEDLEILALIKLGFIDEAEAAIAALPLARQHSPNQLFLEAMLALKTNQLDSFNSLANRLIQWPTEPYTLQSQLIRELDYAELPDRRDAVLAQYIGRYQGHFKALAVAISIFDEFLTIEQTDKLLEQIHELDPAQSVMMEYYAIQVRLFANEPSEAHRLFKAWIQQEAVQRQASQFAWLEQLLTVLAVKRQDDRVVFWELTRKERQPSDAYTTSTKALIVGGDFDTAERIAENGLLYYPHNETLAQLKGEAIDRADKFSLSAEDYE